jgi:tRNA(fMet)-specific endonuclease VapC
VTAAITRHAGRDASVARGQLPAGVPQSSWPALPQVSRSRSAPVIHELRYGCKLLEPSRRRADVERYIDEVVLRIYPVLAYDQAAAKWHAEERARLSKAGRPPPYFDGLIAAIAKVNGLVLVTANVKDFRAFKDLSVENWKG